MSIKRARVLGCFAALVLVTPAGCRGGAALPANEEQTSSAVVTPVPGADFDGHVPPPDGGQPDDEPVQRCAQGYACPVYITLDPGVTQPEQIEVVAGPDQTIHRAHPADSGRYYVLVSLNRAGQAMITLRLPPRLFVKFVDVIPATAARIGCNWQGHAIWPRHLPRRSVIDCAVTLFGNGLVLEAVVQPGVTPAGVLDWVPSPHGDQIVTRDDGDVTLSLSRVYQHDDGTTSGFTHAIPVSVGELAPIPESGAGGR